MHKIASSAKYNSKIFHGSIFPDPANRVGSPLLANRVSPVMLVLCRLWKLLYGPWSDIGKAWSKRQHHGSSIYLWVCIIVIDILRWYDRMMYKNGTNKISKETIQELLSNDPRSRNQQVCGTLEKKRTRKMNHHQDAGLVEQYKMKIN